MNPSTNIYWSKQQCISLIQSSTIHYLTEHDLNHKFKYKYPTYLLSYGGSGNTLTRLIIEYITFIWTGSIYRDPLLIRSGFDAEGKCTQKDNIIAIKAHPEQQELQYFNMDCMNNKAAKRRYKRKQPTYLPFQQWTYSSAIIVIRNPWHSAFTMFKLKQTLQGNKHIDNIPLHKWNVTLFQLHLQQQSLRWLETFEYMNIFKQNNMDYIIIKFENLFIENVSVKEVNKIAEFLFNHKYYEQHLDEIMFKIHCLTEHIISMNYDRFGLVHRRASNISQHVTLMYAFNELFSYNQSCICEFWQNVKTFAVTYGYDMLPIDAITCLNVV